MEKRVILCSDVHLCHLGWYGVSSEDRLETLVQNLNERYTDTPYERIVFLGDYSLDFWEWEIRGSWLNRGLSNTIWFVEDYASRLRAPYTMIPGNHEQYGPERWRTFTGFEREQCFTAGGYLFITCDNFAGNLDPTTHSDGTYTPTDLSRVERLMKAFPDLPVILCAHFFDREKEPEAFFDFLRREKRITLLCCGHDHVALAEDLGERADHLTLLHDGAYSYTGGGRTPDAQRWGFCELTLREDGVEMRYIEPKATLAPDSAPISPEPNKPHAPTSPLHNFEARSRILGTVRRRDL